MAGDQARLGWALFGLMGGFGEPQGAEHHGTDHGAGQPGQSS